MNAIVGLSPEHPDAQARERGEQSYARLTISRNLKSGKLDDIHLTEDQLIRLIANAAVALKTLRGM